MGEVLAAEAAVVADNSAVGFYDSRVVFYHFSISVEEYRDVLFACKSTKA